MKIVRLIALVAVGYLAVTAMWGAALLMNEPTGSPMQIPVRVLEHSPFNSFLIPGIILLVSSGFLGIAVFLLALFRARGYGWWIAFQGCVLFGWITIEVMMLREVVWLHYVYWGIALLLVACGWALRNQAKSAPAPHFHEVASRH
jgi:hypothetical protein